MVKSLGRDCSASPGKWVCAGEQVHPKQEFTFQVCSSVFNNFLGGTFHQGFLGKLFDPRARAGKIHALLLGQEKKGDGSMSEDVGTSL